MGLIKKITKRSKKDTNPFINGELVRAYYTYKEDRSITGYLELVDEDWHGVFCIIQHNDNGILKTLKVPCYNLVKVIDAQ